MRNLATIQKIDWIKPIEGADKIEFCGILGWECVIAKKDNFKENSKRKVIEILGNFESTGLKELADDVIHCDYSLAKMEMVNPFANYIKNMLSKIFGR